MKILVTGADGILGSSLSQTLGKTHNVFAFNRTKMDITDSQQVGASFHEVQPEVLIHCAAITNVELCEKNPDAARAVHVLGTRNLVARSKEYGTRVIYISSTGNYGNYKSDPYVESDRCLPTTVYHQTKFEGEREVGVLGAKGLVLRTGWLFGGTPQHAKNFVYRRYLEAKGAPVLKSDPFQRGNPTSVMNLTRQIQVLIDANSSGIFNVVDHGAISRFDYVKKIFELFGLNVELEKATFTRVAPVSPNESAINQLLQQYGLDQMESWQESLARYIQELKREINV